MNCRLMNSLVVLFVVAVSQYFELRADEKPSDEALAARDFAFEEIPITISLAQFKNQFPDAEEGDATSLELGVTQFLIDSKSASAIGLYFLDEELYQMRILYDSELVKKLGGLSVLLERTKKKFGAPEISRFEKSFVRIVWRFPDVSRAVEWNVENSYARLQIVNTDVLKKLAEKQKQSSKTGLE